MPDKLMKQSRRSRIKLLGNLKNKMGEMQKEGKGGVVSLNIKKPKRPKIVKEKSVLEVLKAAHFEVTKTSQPKEEKDLNTTKEGTVKWFSVTRGWGFISNDEGGKDYFVHHSDINGDINEGDKVTFEATVSPKGLSAKNVIKQSK